MYTEENMEYRDRYDENYEDNNYEENNGSSIWTILLRILIIFLCLLLVIWIISKFIGGSKTKNDGVVLNNNVNAIRLASEKYFFIENNLPKNDNDFITISLEDMKSDGLVTEIKDYKNNVCSTNANESYSTLKKTSYAYVLTVKLTCSEEKKEVTYYYDLEDYECLSCTNDNTYMDGNVVVDGDSSEESESDASTDIEIDEIEQLDISCDKWSDWTSIKIDDSRLLVKTRTLYKGKKTTTDGIETIYGEWSAWSETPVIGSENLEVESKDEIILKWSENKTTTDYITNSDTIKVLSADSVGTEKKCSSSWKTVREKVSASKYQSLNAQGLVIAVHDTYYDVDCNSECETCYTKIYVITYKKKSTSCTGGGTTTMYTYQELVPTTVKMYRSRTVTQEEIKGETVYTDWVEKLEEGYVKIEEKIEYSYKDNSCKG